MNPTETIDKGTLEMTYSALETIADADMEKKIDGAVSDALDNFKDLIEYLVVCETVPNNLLDMECRVDLAMANLKWLVWERNRRKKWSDSPLGSHPLPR